MVFGCPFLASWQSENDEAISKFCLKGAYDQLAMSSMGTDKEGLTCATCIHTMDPHVCCFKGFSWQIPKGFVRPMVLNKMHSNGEGCWILAG